MKATQLTHVLVVIAALFAALGTLLNLWFYAVGGVVIALYLSWRYCAFWAAITALRLDVRRSANKTTVRRGGRVTIGVTLCPNAPLRGLFTDVVPRGSEVVEGTNTAYLSLRAGETHTLSYTLSVPSNGRVMIERATLTVHNGLFEHTTLFETRPHEITRPTYALSVEGGAAGVAGEARSTSVEALYRARSTSAGFEVSHLRPFVAGDPMRRIDWKASARLNKLMTRELLSELEGALRQDEAINLIIDRSGTMGRGPPGNTELDFALNVAGYCIRSAVAKGNRIGLVTYDDRGIATSLEAGDSLPHVSSVVRSLNQLEPSAPLRYPRRKVGVTGIDVLRVKKRFETIRDGETDEDIRRFRYIISYLYAHGDGYVEDLKRAPAFRAIATTVQRSAGQSSVVLVSDLENDLGPLIEGVRLATKRGKRVCVVALFSKVFEQFEDPLLAAEDAYALYEAHKTRIRQLERIPNVKVIEANTAEALRPTLRGIGIP